MNDKSVMKKGLSLLLVSLSVVTLETEASVRNFLEEQGAERLSQLKKHDKTAIKECLSRSFPCISQGTSKLGLTFSSYSELENHFEDVYGEERKVNQTEVILTLYNKLPLTKFCKLLGIAEDKGISNLATFSASRSPLSESTIGRTYLKFLSTDVRKVSYEITGSDTITINRIIKQKNNCGLFKGYIERLKEMKSLIENL